MVDTRQQSSSEAPPARGEATQAVLDALARRLAYLVGFLVFILPITSIPDYLYFGTILLPPHLAIVAAAIVVAVYRDALSARQIGLFFVAALVFLAMAAVIFYEPRSPSLLLLGIAVIVCAVFVDRVTTLWLSAFITLFIFVVFFLMPLQKVGWDVAALDGRVWTVATVWLGTAVFALVLPAMVISDLVDAIEQANLAEKQARHHRYLAERGERSAQEQLQQLLEGCPSQLLLLDEKAEIIGASAGPASILAIGSEALVGMPLFQLLEAASPTHPLLPRLRGIFEGQPFNDQLIQSASESDDGKFSVSGRPILDNAGRVDGAVILATDVSMLLRSRLALSGRDESAELHAVANDVRSPIMALGLSMESLDLMLSKETPDIERIREKIPVVMRQQEHAAEVIESYYDGIRRRDDMGLVSDPTQLAESAQAVLASGFARDSVTIEVIPGSLDGVSVKAQGVLVRQILINLLTNARDAIVTARHTGVIDASAKGSVRMSVDLEPEGVVWTVTDNSGSALPPDPEVLFQQGYTTKAVGEGTGMGLFISRATAQHMGGGLGVSRGAAGLAFSLTLPPYHNDG